ncbi:MAG: hypothetical protein ACPGVB_01920 [Chitinophagales bacterium]
MKNKFNLSTLLCFYLSFLVTMSSCAKEIVPTDKEEEEQEQILELAEEYESCCGADPVEFEAEIQGETIYVYIPNVFTPNDDGKNDKFKPVINEQIQAIQYMVIKKLEEDREPGVSQTLYQVGIVEAEELERSGWDGTNQNGELHKGGFEYSINIANKDGTAYVVEGKACSIICGLDAVGFLTKEGCYFETQATGNGILDVELENLEVGCFE